MKSQTIWSALALAVLCVVPSTTGSSTYTHHVETATINTSNSTQVVVNGPPDDTQQRQEETEYDDQPLSLQTPEPWDDSANDTQGQDRGGYYDQPTEATRAPTNSTIPPVQPSFENPTQPINCPGPEDPTTGEGLLDSNLDCSIVCYNNLVLNDAGDACICPPTFQFDPVEVKCICRSPFVQRGSKCVLLPSQAAGARHGSHKKRSLNQQVPMGVELLHGKYQRSEIDRKHCPSNEIACQMKTGGFECLDPEVTLDSCGGCTSMNTGVDCRNITGAGEVGCNGGVCVVINCQKGFQWVNGGCLPIHYRKP